MTSLCPPFLEPTVYSGPDIFKDTSLRDCLVAPRQKRPARRSSAVPALPLNGLVDKTTNDAVDEAARSADAAVERTGDRSAHAGWSQRRQQLRAPHVAALNDLVRHWRDADPSRPVPWFDPADGGTAARIMLLLEAPGPRTMTSAGSGLCSEDNPDPTNAVIRAQRQAAGLPRTSCVKWNALPWPITSPPKAAETAAAAEHLRQVLHLLPNLDLVITFGARALSVLGLASTLAEPTRALPVLAVPHPSQRNTHARYEALSRLERAFVHAAGVVGHDEGAHPRTTRTDADSAGDGRA